MRLNVIHLLFNAYAHFFVRNLFFIASFLLAYFQSHVQNAMHWHAQSPVNYFRFWENIYFLSLLPYSMRPSGRATNGPNLIGEKLNCIFMKTIFRMTQSHAWAVQNIFQTVQMPFQRWEMVCECASIARIIENNVNSSPAMLAKWHSHTK